MIFISNGCLVTGERMRVDSQNIRPLKNDILSVCMGGKRGDSKIKYEEAVASSI